MGLETKMPDTRLSVGAHLTFHEMFQIPPVPQRFHLVFSQTCAC